MAIASLFFQCLLGMQCHDFAIVAADQTHSQSVIIVRDDEDKLYEMSDKLVMGLNGEVGDRVQFSQFVRKNLELYKMKNKYKLGTTAATYFTRKNMIDAVQNGTPYMINMLMAGYDEEAGAQLYYLDLLGSCIRVPYACHGLGGLLSLSILSNYYTPDLTEVQAYEVLKLCIAEIHKRLLMNLPNFCVKKVSKDGIKMLPIISPSTVTQNYLNIPNNGL